MAFSKTLIRIDAVSGTDRIIEGMREIIARKFHKRGAVIGISGGSIRASVSLSR